VYFFVIMFAINFLERKDSKFIQVHCERTLIIFEKAWGLGYGDSRERKTSYTQ
jgi:hypothetical protein